MQSVLVVASLLLLALTTATAAGDRSNLLFLAMGDRPNDRGVLPLAVTPKQIN